MWLLNRITNAAADLILGPWITGSDWLALSLASLLTAGVLVALFHISSDQAGLRRDRNRFMARVLELLLFQHDLRVSFSACGRILIANIRYLGQMLRPMLVALIPLMLIFTQLACWFEWRPIRVGEVVVLEVELDKSHPVMHTAVEVVPPSHARLDSPPVRNPLTNEIAWRLRATQPGQSAIHIATAGIDETKLLNVGPQLSRVSPLRVRPGLWQEFLNPSEPVLATSSPISRIELTYPNRQLYLGNYEIHWTIAAILLMMFFGLVVGKLCGVRVA